MYGSFPRRAGLAAVLGALFVSAASPATPAWADTTVAQYLKLDKRGQAHLLGTLLQTLGEDLQANNREREAECLQALYTERSEARVAPSPGLQDFLHSVEIARNGAPDKETVEQIIARQMAQYCGTRPK